MGNYLATYFGRLYISREDSDWDIAQRSRPPAETNTEMRLKSTNTASDHHMDRHTAGKHEVSGSSLGTHEVGGSSFGKWEVTGSSLSKQEVGRSSSLGKQEVGVSSLDKQEVGGSSSLGKQEVDGSSVFGIVDKARSLECNCSDGEHTIALDAEQGDMSSNYAGDCVQIQQKRSLPNSGHHVKQSKYMKLCSYPAENAASAESTSAIHTEARCIAMSEVNTSNNIEKLASFQQHNRILFSDGQCPRDNSTASDNTEVLEYAQEDSPIQHLPSVLLIMVFRYLPLADLLHRVALVCRYWYELSHDPDLWRELNLRRQMKVTDEILERVLSYSKGVISIDISDARSVTDSGLEALAKKCPSVICLKLMRCVQLKEPAFKAIGDYCHNLVHLYLDCCFCLSDEALATISAGCPKIRVLHINQCGILSNLGIEAVGKGCRELEDLSMDQCKQVGDPGLLAIIYGCRRLRRLSAMSCVFSSEGIVELVKLPHLQRLELHDVLGVKDDCIIKVVEHCKQLETLNLSLCTRITDRSVEYIARHATNLRALYLASCDLTDKALISIGTYSRSLETLDVGWCSNITDEGARQISEKCQTLRNLGLTRCDKVTVPTMDYLVKQYPYIHYSTFWLDCQRLMSRAQKIGSWQPQHLPT